MTLEEMPYRTTILAGQVDLGDAGIRAWGLLWLVAGVAFLVAAWWTMGARSGWQPFVVVVAVASLLLCVLGWPESRIGVFANLLVLAFVALNARARWM